jgi:integrase
MPGYIKPKGPNRWLVNADLGRDEHGRRKYVAKTVHGTEKDAKKVLRAMETDRDQGTLAKAPATMTLNAYLDQWLAEAKRPKLRPKTFQDYQTLLRLYVRPRLGAKKLTALTPLDVQRCLNAMGDARLSARTIRYTHAVLRGALNQAVKWGLLARNPAAAVDLPIQERREMQALSPAQIDQFRAVAQDLDADGAALYEFMVATGARPSEALGLQWGDVKLDGGKATIQRSVSWTKGGQWSFEGPKTPKSRRLIPLPPSLVATLGVHRQRQLARIIHRSCE